MSTSKKILLGLGAITTSVLSVLAVISCSSSDSFKIDLGISERIKDYYGAKLNTLPAENRKTVVLITAGGKVNDKSFNELAHGATNLYADQTGQKIGTDVSYIETTDNHDLDGAYNQSLINKKEIWVLTGFQQREYFNTWLNKDDNLAKFKELNAVIIGVDWDGSDFVPQGQFFGLGFSTNESSWVIGQAASEFLVTKGLPQKLSAFGGGTLPGVTDFNNGYIQGMLDWNNSQTDNNRKVQFVSGDAETNHMELDFGFNGSAPEINSRIESLLGKNSNTQPQIIMPVAGSLSANTLELIRNKQSNQLIIGVDADQSSTLPAYKESIFTSSEKRIALAIYKALCMLSGVSLDFKDDNTDDAGFQQGFVKGEANAYVKYGFDKGFVGFSKSHLANKEDADLVDTLLAKYYTMYMDPATRPTFAKLSSDPTNNNNNVLDAIIVKINQR